MPDRPHRDYSTSADHHLMSADAEAAREEERQRGADALISASSEARRLGSQTGGYLPAAVPGAGRSGLPESAYDREGLYGYDHSPPGQRPQAPEGEPDSFDLPPLPYMRVTRPPEPHPDVSGADPDAFYQAEAE